MVCMTRIRLALLAAAAAVTVVAIAGCGPDKKAAANAAAQPSTSASSSSPAPDESPSNASSPSPPKTSASASTSTSAAAGKPCTSAAVKLAPVAGSENGAAGSTYIQIALTNAGNASCTIKGYPDFTLTAHSASTQRDVALAAPIQRDTNIVAPFGGTPATVTLQPGAKAVFLLGYSHVPNGPGDCPVANKMHLRLPAQPTEVVAAVTVQVCGGPMRVSKWIPAPAK